MEQRQRGARPETHDDNGAECTTACKDARAGLRVLLALLQHVKVPLALADVAIVGLEALFRSRRNIGDHDLKERNDNVKNT